MARIWRHFWDIWPPVSLMMSIVNCFRADLEQNTVGVDERDEPVQTRFLLRELGGEVVVLAYDVRVWAT